MLVLAGVPLVLAVLIGVVAALPLSMLLLRGLRKRMDAGLAVVRERRSAQREVLRARLRGDELADARSDEAPSARPTPVSTDQASSKRPVWPSTRISARPSAPPSTFRTGSSAAGRANRPSSTGQLRRPPSAVNRNGSSTSAA